MVNFSIYERYLIFLITEKKEQELCHRLQNIALMTENKKKGKMFDD